MSEAGNRQDDKHASHTMTQYRHRSQRAQTRVEWCPSIQNACSEPCVSSAINVAGWCHHAPTSTAILFAFRLRHAQHGSLAAALSEIWSLEATKTAIFSLGYEFSGLASRSCQSKHLAAERLRPVLRGRKTGFPAKSPLLGIISGPGTAIGARHPYGHDPCDALYERYTGSFERIATTERQKGSGSRRFHRSVRLYVKK